MTLIQDTLEAITRRLNSYFQAVEPAVEDWVVLSNVIDEQGQAIDRTTNKLAVFVTNIQQDTTVSTWNAAVPAGTSRFAIVQPTLYINLFVLFFANFSGQNYPRGLGMISQTIQFFQQNPYFTHDNLPDLPAPIAKLSIELVNSDTTDLNNLMGMCGVNYLPSAYYKIRTLPFGSDAIQAQVSASQGYGMAQEPAEPQQAG